MSTCHKFLQASKVSKTSFNEVTRKKIQGLLESLDYQYFIHLLRAAHKSLETQGQLKMEWWNYPEEAWGSENLIFINWSWTRVAQWWEHSPATNVVIRILVSICRLSLLLVLSLTPRGFLWVLQFSPLLKNQHFQIPIQSGKHRHVSTSSWELLIAPWVLKQITVTVQVTWA